MEQYDKYEYCRLLDYLKKDGFGVGYMATFIEAPYYPLADLRYKESRHKENSSFWEILDAPFEDMPLYANHPLKSVAYWRISVGR